MDTKANYVSHILKNDKDVRASLSNILNDVKEEGKGKESSLKYVILIIIIIIVIIFLSYLVMRKRQSSPSILNYSIPNYLI